MIRQIINDGAQAYKGVIPQDRWKEPYLLPDELRREMRDGAGFWHGALDGVMGLQLVKDVSVRTQR
jgi:hypothetical protein